MDDVYTMEIVRQGLIDSCKREDGLMLQLHAAQEEAEELKSRAIVNKIRLQELDEALEVEETNTNVERLARQNAEATTRQHSAEMLKAKRKEDIANKHCESAESEVLRLQRELSMERSATGTANRLLCQLREDLGLAELNQGNAYEQLSAAKAKLSILQEALGTATNRISMLECQATQSGEFTKNQRQRVEDMENALRTNVYELKDYKIKLSDTLERLNELRTKHMECDFASSVTATAFDTDTVDVHKQSPINLETVDQSRSDTERQHVLENDRGIEENMVVKAMLSTAKNQTIIPSGKPAFPELAILRPAPALVTTSQIDTFKSNGRTPPAPRANLNNPPWKLLYWLRPNLLHFLFRGSARK